MAEIGTVIDGKYEILREIGKGGMSVVYLAMDTRLNKQWAIKEVKKQANGENNEVIENSLLVEANMMKKLDHPALPRIVDIIDNGTTINVVMDYIEGESLHKILKEYGAQSEELVLGWAKQLCDALSYLHAQKPPIIYRDVKPQNIMLKPEGNIKIIDFGIAREYKEGNLADTAVLGTKGYAPPEQYVGQTDARSDIYALGKTMHHLLTGVSPIGKEYQRVRYYNPELSEGVERIIDKCVEPAPENRYQNCQDLLYDLEHPELITRGYKRKQKRRLSAFLSAAVLSIVCLITGVICNRAAIYLNNNQYDELISTSTASSLDIKVDNYKTAIKIYPEKTEAYICMLQAYEDGGKFGKEESDEFLALYNANKDNIERMDYQFADLNYEIGKMYFNYYEETEGLDSFSTRIQKAYSFFEENNKNTDSTYENKILSDCYYQICSFYKTYILNTATVEEASKENYEMLLFTNISQVMSEIENIEPYEQLMFYNGVFMFLYDQRASMVQVNVEQDRVIQLLEEIYKKADYLTVQKEQSKELQNEILQNYNSYKDAIKRAYENADKRANEIEEENK